MLNLKLPFYADSCYLLSRPAGQIPQKPAMPLISIAVPGPQTGSSNGSHSHQLLAICDFFQFGAKSGTAAVMVP